jgi:hypothetical protein
MEGYLKQFALQWWKTLNVDQLQDVLQADLIEKKPWELTEEEIVSIWEKRHNTSFGSRTYIMCSAIYYDDDVKYPHQPRNIESGIVVCGRRHHNCITTMARVFKDGVYKRGMIQGFLTSDDKFVTREEAYDIAKEANQLKVPDMARRGLMSEDLW